MKMNVQAGPSDNNPAEAFSIVNEILESIILLVEEAVDPLILLKGKRKENSKLKRSKSKKVSTKKVLSKIVNKENTIPKKAKEKISQAVEQKVPKKRGRPRKTDIDQPKSMSDKQKLKNHSLPLTVPGKRKYTKQSAQNPYSTKKYPKCPHGRPKPSRKITFDVAGVSTSVMITENLDIRRWDNRIVGLYEIVDFPPLNIEDIPKILQDEHGKNPFFPFSV